ncbi:hypothetical protein BT69DRAFT_1292426 [Atractiella rhizophila]|nr:hypothetical protein BT69DRAFT_1292426 [Atractiella rhizophila]
MPTTGKCLCGAVTLTLETVEGEPLQHALCHCTNCQLSGGAPIASYFIVPESRLKVDGTLITTIAKADSGNDVTYDACAKCGSPITHGSKALGENIGVRSPLLPTLKPSPIVAEFFTCNRWETLKPLDAAVQLNKME